MDRKKDLRQQYKQMKSDMGVFSVRCKTNNKCYIEATHDLRSKLNSTRFKLVAGVHPNRELQKEWTSLGVDNFTIETLENLPYDKDDAKSDYTEELALLQMIWEERLTKDNIELY